MILSILWVLERRNLGFGRRKSVFFISLACFACFGLFSVCLTNSGSGFSVAGCRWFARELFAGAIQLFAFRVCVRAFGVGHVFVFLCVCVFLLLELVCRRGAVDMH